MQLAPPLTRVVNIASADDDRWQTILAYLIQQQTVEEKRIKEQLKR